MAMSAAQAALQEVLECLAALDAVALTVAPQQLMAAAQVEALVTNPELLDDLERFLPRVIRLLEQLQAEL